MKNTQQREIGLRSIIQSHEETLQKDLNNILYRRNKIVLGAVLTHLARLSQARGTYSYFVNGDVSALKQHYYVASRLAVVAIEQNDGDGSDLNTHEYFLFALLSDNTSVINALAHAKTKKMIEEQNNPQWRGFHIHLIQLAMQGAYEELKEKLEILAKGKAKYLRDKYEKEQDFYRLLIIVTPINNHTQQSTPPMNRPACAICA